MEIFFYRVISPKTRPDGIARGRAGFTVKKTHGNSGIPEPAASLVVPQFPRLPDSGGHNSGKCGTGPELPNDARREQMRPDIAT